MSKIETLGDMPQKEQDLRWENDPHVLPPPTPKQLAQMELDAFEFFKERGYKPEQLFKTDPKARARYREYLKTVS